MRVACEAGVLDQICRAPDGDEATGRAGELRAIVEWMARWAKQEEDWGHNLIALGDFNIDRIGDPNFEAFTSTGLRPPTELEGLPRTIFDEGGEYFYDQIAWFTTGGTVPVLSLQYTGNAGNFDFTKSLQGDMSLTSLSWKISDRCGQSSLWRGSRGHGRRL